jgi:hypothetical protein
MQKVGLTKAGSGPARLMLTMTAWQQAMPFSPGPSRLVKQTVAQDNPPERTVANKANRWLAGSDRSPGGGSCRQD